ncbi:protein-glutamine glutaminase family protein [Chryseobacterium nematophagum]|nr:protein-glutamine glutaminase family protein [Chryseobacterium nematophagum]
MAFVMTALTSCNQDRDDSFSGASVSLTANKTASRMSSSNAYTDYDSYFNTIKNDVAFTWDYKRDGCFARAHKMRRILEANGIPSSSLRKIWIGKKGKSLLNDWNFHVALVVVGADGESHTGKVIDPALFPDGPVTPKKWATECNKGIETADFAFTDVDCYTPKNVLEINYKRDSYYLDWFGANQSADRAANCVLSTIRSQFNPSFPNGKIEIIHCTGNFTAR